MSKTRQKLNINNIKEGLRVRIGLPRLWLGFPHHPSPMVWMKGKVKKVAKDKLSCIIYAKHKKYHIKEKFFCIAHSENKLYDLVELIR